MHGALPYSENLYQPQHSPRYHENQAKCTDDDQPCFLCGRPISQPRFWSRTWEGALLVTDAYADAQCAAGHGGSDTGNYPIGPECVRKLPAPVRRKFVKEA